MNKPRKNRFNFDSIDLFSGRLSNYVETSAGIDDVIQKHIKMTKDATLEGSSQQANKDAINRRNGQRPKHLKFFLLVFLTRRPKPKKHKPKWGPKPKP